MVCGTAKCEAGEAERKRLIPEHSETSREDHGQPSAEATPRYPGSFSTVPAWNYWPSCALTTNADCASLSVIAPLDIERDSLAKVWPPAITRERGDVHKDFLAVLGCPNETEASLVVPLD